MAKDTKVTDISDNIILRRDGYEGPNIFPSCKNTKEKTRTQNILFSFN